MLQDMERERQRIEDDIALVTYYMNGGLPFDTAYSLEMAQLMRLHKTITNHFEQQNEAIKKSNNTSGR